MRAAAWLAVLAALPLGAAAETTTVWAFEGDAAVSSAIASGLPCSSAPFGLPGQVRLALLDSPGGGFDALGFAFDTGASVRVPCALSRAGCVGEGDAARGWRGVCAEGLPYVTWRLEPRADGRYAFTSVSPLGPAGWALTASVAERAAVPLPA